MTEHITAVDMNATLPHRAHYIDRSPETGKLEPRKFKVVGMAALGTGLWPLRMEPGTGRGVLVGHDTDPLRVKDVAQSHDRGLDYSATASVAAHLEEAQPRWVAFNGMTAGKNAAKWLGHRTTDLGVQSWAIGQSPVFVLPSSSGAHAVPYADKLKWWSDLAAHIRGAC